MLLQHGRKTGAMGAGYEKTLIRGKKILLYSYKSYKKPENNLVKSAFWWMFFAVMSTDEKQMLSPRTKNIN